MRCCNNNIISAVEASQIKLSSPQTFIAGIIYDNDTGKPIPAYIDLVTIATGKPLVSTDPPFYCEDGKYSAWTDHNLKEVGIKFTAKGYKDQIISFADLLTGPDMFMEKNNGIPWWAIALVIAAVAAYRKKSGKVGKLETSDTLVIFLLIGGVLAFDLVQKILALLGLSKDPTTPETENPDSPFKPAYWQKFTSYTYALTETQAKAFCTTIHDAFSWYEDDYNQIMSVFSQMRTKANVSFLAWEFQKQYNEDLLTFLTNGGGILPWDGLSSSHLQSIINLVNKLPTN